MLSCWWKRSHDLVLPGQEEVRVGNERHVLITGPSTTIIPCDSYTTGDAIDHRTNHNHHLSSLAASASASPSQFSWRRSLRQLVRACGYQPVTHTIFTTPRTPDELIGRTKRFVLSLAGGLFIFYGMSYTFQIPGRILDWSFGSEDDELPRILLDRNKFIGAGWMLKQPALKFIHRIPKELESIQSMNRFRRLGLLSLIGVGSVLTLTGMINVLTTCGWIKPQREGYTAISHAMAQGGIGENPTTLSITPTITETTLQSCIRTFNLITQSLSSAVIEEQIFSSIALGLVHMTLGTQFILVRMVVAGIAVGIAHQAFEGEKVASTAIRAGLNELLYHASSVLPHVIHLSLNFIARDSYAAISPLRGLKMVGDVFTPDASTHELFANLKHHFDPRHGQLVHSSACFLRNTPLRVIFPQTRHPFFAQPSTNGGLIFGPPNPSATQISSKYSRVISEIFAALDTQDRGYLTHQQFSFIFFLQHEPLEILRAAFTTLDEALAYDTRMALQHPLDQQKRVEYNDAENIRTRTTLQWGERDAYYQRLHLQVLADSHPLESFVIQPTLTMPELETPPTSPEEFAAAYSRRFVCREWMERSARGLKASEWLLLTLRQAGATKVHDPDHHYSFHEDDQSGSSFIRDGVHSGWKPSVLYSRSSSSQPFQPSWKPRFHRLINLFHVYVDLVAMGAFQAHLEYYGEMTRNPDFIEEEKKEEVDSPTSFSASSSSSSVPRFIRRFTHSSFHAWIRDLALFDVHSTDALLTQTTLTLHGTMTHPMHIYNVAYANFK